MPVWCLVFIVFSSHLTLNRPFPFKFYQEGPIKWVQVFKNGPSKICGRQLLQIVAFSILGYSDPNVKQNTRKKRINDSYFQQIVLTSIPKGQQIHIFFLFLKRMSYKPRWGKHSQDKVKRNFYKSRQRNKKKY